MILPTSFYILKFMLPGNGLRIFPLELCGSEAKKIIYTKNKYETIQTEE